MNSICTKRKVKQTGVINNELPFFLTARASPETPADAAGKKRILRSLKNIRMPKILPSSVLAVQDEYLQERNRKNGIVTLNEIPTIASQGSLHPYADRISIWQGDITRLAADAVVNAANSQMLGCFVPMIFLRRK